MAGKLVRVRVALERAGEDRAWPGHTRDNSGFPDARSVPAAFRDQHNSLHHKRHAASRAIIQRLEIPASPIILGASL